MLKKALLLTAIVGYILTTNTPVRADEYVNVAKLGVVPSPSVDAAPRINAIIDSLAAMKPYERKLFFPAGTSYIAEPIILKSCISILGEELRGTKIETMPNFSGHAMIQNFAGNGDPGEQDKISYYNTIENFYLKNTYQLPNMVMMWLVHLWEGSYVRSIHFDNTGTVRGGLWHTRTKAVAGGGGQVFFENLNVFYNRGVCTEENVKIENDGGLNCKNWNILGQYPASPTTPCLSFDATCLILSVQNVHVENTPGNGQPSVKIKGSGSAQLILRECDIDVTTAKGERVGIEVDLSKDSQSQNTTEWDIENIAFHNCSGAPRWQTVFDVPLRIVRSDGKVEKVTEAMDHIRKCNNMTRLFDTKSANTSNDLIGLGQGILYQQSIGTVKDGGQSNINTPDMIQGYIDAGNMNEDKITDGKNSAYSSKSYLIIVSGYRTPNGDPRGGAFLVMKGHAASITVLPLNASQGITVVSDGEGRIQLKNNTGQNLTRVSAMILGFGTDNE